MAPIHVEDSISTALRFWIISQSKMERVQHEKEMKATTCDCGRPTLAELTFASGFYADLSADRRWAATSLVPCC